MSEQLSLIREIFAYIDNHKYDRESIPQEKLDLTNKNRSSMLPWRGQFSPELIEILLNYYSDKNSIILDPFVGSGTTIFEAAKKELTVCGISSL